MINIENGSITIDNKMTISPATSLSEFQNIAKGYFKLDVFNIPYRSYCIVTGNYEFRFYFKSQLLREINIAMIPYSLSTKTAMDNLFKNEIPDSQRTFSWGEVFINVDRFCDIYSLVLRYVKRTEEPDSSIVKIPPFNLIAKPLSRDAKVFFKEMSPKIWQHRIGGIPDCLKTETGPLCTKCNKEMTFYAKLALPMNLKDSVYVFICFACNETTSVIKETSGFVKE